jgi:hypothetical protein
MADWYGTARSNYFKVRDNKSFSAFMQQNLSSMTAVHKIEDNTWWIITDEFGNGGFDWTVYDEDFEPDDSVDAMNEFASHLQEGEVAIFFEAGAEKLRYITGSAVAIAWNGEITEVCLNDIYDLVAKKYGIEPSRAEY